MVRFWAKMQQLAGGGKPDTLITNYALTMLMSFAVTRCREILPSLMDLRRQPYKKIIINGWNCGFGENTDKFSNKSHNCSVLQLVLEFFVYYAELDPTEWVICPLVGRLVSRKDMASKSLPTLGRDFQDYVDAPGNLQHETPLCVQDPFDLAHNVTRGLKKIALERFQLLCRQSAVVVQQIMHLQAPLVALFQPIELTDDMYATEEHDKSQHQNVTCDEVIVLDDDADSTQDIEILEEVQQVLKRHEDIKIIHDSKTSRSRLQGTKRTIGSNAAASMNCLSPAEVFLCTSVQLDSSTVYQLRLNPDIVYKVGADTGALSIDPNSTTFTVDSSRKLALDIVVFILTKVYAAEVNKTELSDESPQKRIKNSSVAVGTEKSLSCYAKLDVFFKYDLREGKTHIRAVSTIQTLDKISPFSQERNMTERQIRLIEQGQEKFGKVIPEKSFSFFVCHNVEKVTEIVLIANTIDLSNDDEMYLTQFCNNFSQLTNTCLRKANILVKDMNG